MGNTSITKHKLLQELVCQLAFPVYSAVAKARRTATRLIRAEGISYGLNRARWRARIGALGAYSDIAENTVVRGEKNLYIGVRTSISPNCFIDACGGVIIGDHVMISHMVSINSMSHESTPPYHRPIMRRTVIENHAWIGAGCIILDGVTIGEGAIVAAGAVVNRDVAPYTVVAGVPARKIREIKG